LQDDILQPQYQLLFRDEVVELASWLDGNGVINGGRENGAVAIRLRMSAGVHRLQRRSSQVVVKTTPKKKKKEMKFRQKSTPPS
jgi:hypothetical protein